MPRKSKAVLGVVLAAIALVALSASFAFADSVTVHLQVDRTKATFGQDVVIAPSIEGTVPVTGDSVTLEALGADGVTWSSFGEGLKVEDTGTIDPQLVNVDSSFLPWFTGTWRPITFRAKFTTSRTKNASGTVVPFSSMSVEQPSLQIVKLARPKLTLVAPRRVNHGKYFSVSAQTKPWAGQGTLVIKVLKQNGKTFSTIRTYTDDTGYGLARFKIAKHGSYKLQFTWLGNGFAPASKSYVTALTVR